MSKGIIVVGGTEEEHYNLLGKDRLHPIINVYPEENDIYNKLCKYGNENAAIKLAEQKLTEQIRNGVELPSKMCPCTTLHLLVKEIKNKT